MRRLNIAFGVAVLSAMLWPSASAADDLNRKTVLTFSGPIGLPGLSLPPGTYTFQLVGSTGGSPVTEVLDKDGTHVIKTFLTIPSEMVEPSDRPSVTLARRAPGAPEAITAWFYPGERTGYEFVYPREQAAMNARAAEVATPVAEAAPPAAAASADNTQGATAAPPRPTAQAPSEPDADRPAAPATKDLSAGRDQLPKTASSLPWIALLSGLCFTGSLGMRWFRSER